MPDLILDEIGERVHAVYARVPDIGCKGLCSDYCGMIDMSNAEKVLIEANHGRLPSVDEHGTCTMLVDGRCSIYADRPLICRVWGVERSLPCPHGCKPRLWGHMSADRAMVLFRDLNEIAGGMEATREMREWIDSLLPEEKRKLEFVLRRIL